MKEPDIIGGKANHLGTGGAFLYHVGMVTLIFFVRDFGLVTLRSALYM